MKKHLIKNYLEFKEYRLKFGGSTSKFIYNKCKNEKGELYVLENGMLEFAPTDTTDKIVQSVISDLNERSKVGILKYNTTLERDDLSLKDWLQHAYEETLDKANYLKRAIIELEHEERN